MNYFINQIWQNKETVDFYRILHVNPQLEILVWININEQVEELPELIDFAEFEALQQQNKLLYTPNEIIHYTLPENLKPTTLKKWERNWDVVKEYLDDFSLLYDKKKLNYLLNKILVKRTGLSRNTIRRIFIKFWQRGMTKLAVIPDYSKSGGRGRVKQSSQLKRGRPPVYTKGELNVDDKVRKMLVAGYEEFYLKRQSASLQNAYQAFIALKFSKKAKKIDSRNIPTISQFRYWGKKNFQRSKECDVKLGT